MKAMAQDRQARMGSVDHPTGRSHRIFRRFGDANDTTDARQQAATHGLPGLGECCAARLEGPNWWKRRLWGRIAPKDAFDLCAFEHPKAVLVRGRRNLERSDVGSPRCGYLSRRKLRFSRLNSRSAPRIRKRDRRIGLGRFSPAKYWPNLITPKVGGQRLENTYLNKGIQAARST